MAGTTDGLVELDVLTVAHGGVSVARLEGRVVFVSDTLPGERVLARVTDDSKSSFWRAETVEVLEPSPHRRPHVWAAAGLERAPEDRAGGAEFGHIDLAHQRALKTDVLTDALKRQGRIDRVVEVAALPGDEESDGLGWRTRLTLHTDGRGALGPYAARSHRVIDVDAHPLARPAIEAAALAEARAGSSARSEGGELSFAETADGDVLISSGRHDDPILERVGDRLFRVARTGFWQVHRGAPTALTAAVQEAVDADRFDPAAANLDLYGGVGLLAAALGDRFGRSTRVTSVESDAVATGFAQENLADWVGASAVTARVDRYLDRVERSASSAERRRLAGATVVLDPPRSGAGKAVVGSLTRLGVAQVVYVACDPVAFARDVALFGEAGYTLGRAQAFDLFPHTHHLETVGTFTRAD
ncbi:SAM-dependent methyltransferase [Cnuibacter physcomitrellae]|uniref:23S rRNA methyltransferase n=1 Tax=Cnuibacter physcomitrellae TaxID=1619308 RepID=A0A1X9LQ09_9MICO|nr:TRAM domain-containing protein [Cnuibacter physcomitrellae]ARJ06021.1 23S rRNA methyltransferase [Cnuibacter physcomitrellae]GGI37040.1 SAM-dependent methyltransferase [Cnuibacter physcomitrellae]